MACTTSKALPISNPNSKIEIPTGRQNEKKPAIAVAGPIAFIPYRQMAAYFFINGLAQIDA
ncbi:Uncharacterised protein [Serratia entomophila]|nr:Uncharacterised protein [Serratia entomophila]CAI1712029.1 Uncharacterised protein [Serratia entomophila]CAI1732625.1 Uncharacterised protein [Serratia entomophila]CAI1757293.1 Uncharacterised protein [Serratia entomophila]CAI1762539.1 Uncharacterised protein [Serratia entomophila]